MPELIGRGLFVFSDPGGAKPILSLITSGKVELKESKIISDRWYNFFSDFNVEVNAPSSTIEVDFYFQPDFVFTGTSYSSRIELKYLERARELSIPTYSFVDHWSSIRQRFDNNGREILPDYILVLDDRAKQLAIGQGLDIKKIIVIGNPYHDWLRGWRPVIDKNVFFEQVGFKDRSKKILLYAPDPLSNVNGVDEYGFDERVATELIVKLFDANYERLRHWHVFVKPHPNQQIEVLANIVAGHASFNMLSGSVDTNTSIYYSDIVVGFFSSILLEAALMNKTILRFLDWNVKFDPIAELKLGRIVGRQNFVSTLEEIMHGIE